MLLYMNTSNKFVITINRELGTGGRTVAKLLAQKLGVPFYDRAHLASLEDKEGLNDEEIDRPCPTMRFPRKTIRIRSSKPSRRYLKV